MSPDWTPSRIVAAPNPYKGSLGALAVAAAIARGARSVFPAAEVVEVPIADGGEGTVEALVAAAHGTFEEVVVEGPLGAPVAALYGLIDGGRTAVVELASSSGLPLVEPAALDPGRASTFGFGQLLEAVRRRGVGRIVVGIGGSATNDGGAGMAQALGYRLLDAEGRELPRGGAALARLSRIEASGVDLAWRQVRVDVACDVTNPLTGPRGATAVYGPQKGVTAALAGPLDEALARLAVVIAADLGREVAEEKGAGAAGGAGAGLLAFLGASLRPGAALVIEAAGLAAALDGADLAFTGEGRIDGQTLFGKGPIEVARLAARAGIPVIALAGTAGEGWEAVLDAGITAVLPIAEGPGTLEHLTANAAGLVERAAARACRLVAAGIRVAERRAGRPRS